MLLPELTFKPNLLKINLQVNQYALEAQKLSLNKDIAQTKNDVSATESNLTNYELQVQQANEALQLASVRYKRGNNYQS